VQDTIQLGEATLLAGPSEVCEGDTFPAGGTTIPLALLGTWKPYVVDSGRQLYNVASPAAFVPLNGVGASGPVTQAHTLYLRVLAPVQVQLTYFGVVSAQVVYLSGLLLVEPDPAHPVTAVAVMGTAQVEFLAVGNL
jgi:hypothetical protein